MADPVHGKLGGGVFQRTGSQLHRGELGDLCSDGVFLPVLGLLHIEEWDAKLLDVHALHLVVQVPVRRVLDQRVLQPGEVPGVDVRDVHIEGGGCAEEGRVWR